MKMTLHIDEALLARVIEEYGIETKTEAVHFALHELDRRAQLKVFAKEGLGLTPEELADAVDPNYRLESYVAEDEAPYGSARPH
jgi:Arc/MetJ family transcription regulator